MAPFDSSLLLAEAPAPLADLLRLLSSRSICSSARAPPASASRPRDSLLQPVQATRRLAPVLHKSSSSPRSNGQVPERLLTSSPRRSSVELAGLLPRRRSTTAAQARAPLTLALVLSFLDAELAKPRRQGPPLRPVDLRLHRPVKFPEPPPPRQHRSPPPSPSASQPCRTASTSSARPLLPALTPRQVPASSLPPGRRSAAGDQAAGAPSPCASPPPRQVPLLRRPPARFVCFERGSQRCPFVDLVQR
nr:proline-rich protein 36-like [Aegilops tauschii subsp. strangulata]